MPKEQNLQISDSSNPEMLVRSACCGRGALLWAGCPHPAFFWFRSACLAGWGHPAYNLGTSWFHDDLRGKREDHCGRGALLWAGCPHPAFFGFEVHALRGGGTPPTTSEHLGFMTTFEGNVRITVGGVPSCGRGALTPHFLVSKCMPCGVGAPRLQESRQEIRTVRRSDSD